MIYLTILTNIFFIIMFVCAIYGIISHLKYARENNRLLAITVNINKEATALYRKSLEERSE